MKGYTGKKKSATNAFGGSNWGLCGDSIGVGSCRGQWQSRTMSPSAGVRQGQRMGKAGAAHRGAACPTVQDICPAPKSLQWPSNTRYALRNPQSCFLYETSSHTQRGLGLVWRQCFSTSAKSYTLQIAELVGSFLSSYRFSHLVTLISPTSHITALLFIRSEFVRMYKPLPMNWVHNRKVKQEKQPSEEYTEVYAENFDQFYSHFQFFLRFLEFD